MITWTRHILLGTCVLTSACVVTVSEGDGNLGDAGQAGAGSSGGSDSGGAGGMGTSAGGEAGGSDMPELDAGTSEEDTTLDGGSMSLFPTPTCAAVEGDSACEQCLKQKCCDPWRACDDQLCADEWTAVADCVGALDVLDAMTYGECVSSSVATGIPETNTIDLLECISEEDTGDELTRCGVVCFGDDYLPL